MRSAHSKRSSGYAAARPIELTLLQGGDPLLHLRDRPVGSAARPPQVDDGLIRVSRSSAIPSTCTDIGIRVPSTLMTWVTTSVLSGSGSVRASDIFYFSRGGKKRVWPGVRFLKSSSALAWATRT